MPIKQFDNKSWPITIEARYIAEFSMEQYCSHRVLDIILYYNYNLLKEYLRNAKILSLRSLTVYRLNLTIGKTNFTAVLYGGIWEEIWNMFKNIYYM